MVYPKSAPPDFLGTGWAFPLSVRGGRLETTSDAALIRQSIGLILGTARGERVMLPRFGCALKRLVFDANNEQAAHLVDHAVREALREWEPRIKVTDVATKRDGDAPDLMLIRIDYVIRAFNSRDNLVYPFFLGVSGA